MRKILLGLLLWISLPMLAAYSLIGDSVKIEDFTLESKPNYYVTVFAHTSSATYKVYFDVWPTKAYIVGSFSAKDETINYYSCGLTKSNGYEYYSESDSQIELTITKINDDTCELTATIQAARKGTSYTYNIATFRFPYEAGGEPEDPTLDPYRFEPKDSTSFTFTGDVVSVRDRREERDVIEVTLNAIGDSSYHWVELNMMLDTFTMPVGTYTFSADSASGTILASPGYKKKSDQPSYVAIRADKEGWGQYTPYYIIKGSLTFSLNEEGDTVFVKGNVTSKHGSAITIDVTSYNMFYEKPEPPREPEEVELAIDTVVITYLRNESDSALNYHFYTLNFFSNSADNYPTVIVDAILPQPGQMVAGTYSWADSTLNSLALYQNQNDFESALWGGFPYIFTKYSLTLTEKTDSLWEYTMDIRDTIGSHYYFTLVQNPHVEIYPALDTIPEEDKPYIQESKEKTSKQWTFTTIEWNDSTVSKDGILGIKLYEGAWNVSNQQSMVELCLFTPTSDVAAGTYPINDSEKDGTFMSSYGKFMNVQFPCYAARFDYLMNVHAIWYLMDGTITIAYPQEGKMQITGDCTSYFGSSIQFSYTGTKPSLLKELVGNSIHTTKILRNGCLEIIRNDTHYDILGNRQ